MSHYSAAMDITVSIGVGVVFNQCSIAKKIFSTPLHHQHKL